MDIAGKHEMPTVVAVDALIEILAVDGAGPDFDASEFAPLLARMILMQCEPPKNTYSLVDLEWLRRISQSAIDVPPEKTKEIAEHVAAERTRGRTLDSTVLQLDVHRMLQSEAVDSETAVRQSSERAQRAEALARDEMKRRQRRDAAFVQLRARELKRSALNRLILGMCWRVPGFLGVAFGVWIGARTILPDGTASEIFSYVATAITMFAGGWMLVWNRLRGYRDDGRKALSQAKAEVREGQG